MTHLVTGAAGFIGSHLVDRLLADGRDVVGIDNFDDFYPPATKRRNLASAMAHPRFRLVAGDVRDRASMARIVLDVRPSAIAHLAARAGVRPSIEDPGLYADVNLVGTANLLQAACSIEPRPRFILASSSSVYGDRDSAPFRESDPVDRPVSPYAASKRACELMASTFHHLHGLPVTALRFFTAYGPRNRPDLAIARFAALIDAGLPVPMFGDGSTRRDYTFVDDIVDGVVRALDRCGGWHVYNLGNSSPIELSAMISSLASALGKSPEIRRLPEQPGDVRQTFADIGLAAADLGYSPRTPFATGLDQFAEWWRGDRSSGSGSAITRVLPG